MCKETVEKNLKADRQIEEKWVGIVHSPDVTESMRILFVSHHPIKIWVRIEIMNIEKTFPSIQPHLARF
jgi:hypothetical protein